MTAPNPSPEGEPSADASKIAHDLFDSGDVWDFARALDAFASKRVADAVEAEREACAKVAQDRADWCRKEHQNGAHFDTLHAHERSAETVAGRIRARSPK